MKIAQIKQFITLPLILGANYLKPEEKIGLDGVRLCYIVSQIVTLMVLIKIFLSAKKSTDKTVIEIPEQKSMGQVVKPAAEMTVAEYDVSQVKELLKQTLIGAAILGGIHYKWETVMPLVIQALLTPFNTLTHNVSLVYLFGMPAEGELARPWVPASPFEMPKLDNEEDKKEDKKADAKAAKKAAKAEGGGAAKKKGRAAAPKPDPVAKKAASGEALKLAGELHKMHKSELADLSVKQLKEHLAGVGTRPQLVTACSEKGDMVELLQDVVETLMDNDFGDSKKMD